MGWTKVDPTKERPPWKHLVGYGVDVKDHGILEILKTSRRGGHSVEVEMDGVKTLVPFQQPYIKGLYVWTDTAS